MYEKLNIFAYITHVTKNKSFLMGVFRIQFIMQRINQTLVYNNIMEKCLWNFEYLVKNVCTKTAQHF